MERNQTMTQMASISSRFRGKMLTTPGPRLPTSFPQMCQRRRHRSIGLHASYRALLLSLEIVRPLVARLE